MFDGLVTVDRGLRYQQNVSRFAIGVVVVETVDTTLQNLRRLLPEIKARVLSTGVGEIAVIQEDR